MKKLQLALLVFAAVISFATTSSAHAARKGLGITTVVSGGALSYLSEINTKDALQLFTRLSSTDPFIFSLGGIYRHNVVGTHNGGLHLGGTLQIGSESVATATGVDTEASFALGPVAGLHYALPQLQQVMFSLDAGAILDVGDDETTFTIAPLSAILGLSVHYAF